MTLGEFALREYAYRRQEQWEWAKYRMVAYWAVRSFNIDPKSIPKTPKDIIDLDFVDASAVTNRQLEAFKAAQKRFDSEVKKKNGG